MSREFSSLRRRIPTPDGDTSLFAGSYLLMILALGGWSFNVGICMYVSAGVTLGGGLSYPVRPVSLSISRCPPNLPWISTLVNINQNWQRAGETRDSIDHRTQWWQFTEYKT